MDEHCTPVPDYARRKSGGTPPAVSRRVAAQASRSRKRANHRERSPRLPGQLADVTRLNPSTRGMPTAGTRPCIGRATNLACWHTALPRSPRCSSRQTLLLVGLVGLMTLGVCTMVRLLDSMPENYEMAGNFLTRVSQHFCIGPHNFPVFRGPWLQLVHPGYGQWMLPEVEVKIPLRRGRQHPG